MANPLRHRTVAAFLVGILPCLASAGGPGTARAGTALLSDPIVRGLAEVRSLLDSGRYGESHARCRTLLQSAESLGS